MTQRVLAGLCAVAGLATLSMPRTVDANLPASAITELSMEAYGLYTTSDPLCQTGLVATLPLTALPTPTNLAASPTLGTGDLPADGIACVVMVVKDSFTLRWAAGSYTGTSQFGTSTYDDANCDPGGSEGPMSMCRDSIRGGPTWPQQILDDLAAAGLTGATDCSGPGSLDNVIPLYLSAGSKCIGEVNADTAIGGECDWQLNTDVTPEGYRSNTLWQAPTQLDDPLHGVHIDALPGGSTTFKFIADPTPTIGGNGNDSCGGLNPPRFSFVPLD